MTASRIRFPGTSILRAAHLPIVLPLLLAAAAPGVRAQTVYLRIPGTPFCSVTNATNATPIRLTVNNAASCGITANGQVILVAEVRGTTAANIHLESPTDTVNLARKVANLTGNSFDLTDLADNPVAGNGAYLNGGRVGVAAPYTLRPHPRLYLDGPTGPLTTSLDDTGPTGRANPANLPWIALKNATDFYNNSLGYAWGNDTFGNKTLSDAMRWFVDGDPASRTGALYGLTNVTQVLGTLACDETERGCYTPGSSMRDYPSQNMEPFSQAYSIMYSERTPAENALWASFLLNDLPWSQGGIDYTGATWTKPTWKHKGPGPGTVTYSGTTVTGTGTSFLTEGAVGDIIVMGHNFEDVYGQPYIITAINSDTELIVNRPVQGPNGNYYMIGPPWNPSFYGLVWHQKHYEAALMCGGATVVPEGLIATCETNYGFQSGYDQSGSQNLVLARLLGNYAMGLALCGDDPRACLLLELANEFFVDVALPRALTVWTGFSQSAPGYHNWRMYNIVLSLGLMSKLSFTASPDYFAGTDLISKAARYGMAAYLPYQTAYVLLPINEPAIYDMQAQQMRTPLLGIFGDPQSNDARQFRDWLYNRFPGYTESFIRVHQGEFTWFHFLYNDPAATPLPAPTTNVFPTTNRAQCIAWYGAARCPDGEGRFMFVSNQNWSAERTYLAFNGTSYRCLDHCSTDLGGWTLVAKNGQALIAGDSNNLMGERPGRNYIELGGTPSNLRGFPELVPVHVLWSGGNDQFMVANLNLTQTFKPAVKATGVTRQLIHLKAGAQDYIVDHARAATSAATSIRGFQHYHLNGCGTPSSTTCVSLSSASGTASNTQPGAKLTSKAFGIGGAVLVSTESGIDTDGSYIGGEGKTFRWTVCPTVPGSGVCTPALTEAEWVVVHKPSTNPGDSLPAIVQGSSGIFRILEIQDPTAPKVALFTAAGQTGTGASLNTTHAGTAQYVVSGLEPGPYTVSRNGVELGSFTAATGTNAISFSSLSGAIEIVAGPPPMTISTASLPNGVQGKPYSKAISALGVPTPYAWQLTSGTPCAGLSFTQVGNQAIIAGTPTALETCTFTVQVTNATASETDSRQFSITIIPPGPPIVFTTTALSGGRSGDSYFGRIQATGGTEPLTWSISSGSLCPGLTLNTATGVITGTPAAVGTCSFTARVTDLGNEFVERPLFIDIIANNQTSLSISSARVSFSAVVLEFGRRGLDSAAACSVVLRLGGPGGSVLSTIASGSGPSRRSVIGTGLPAGQIIHATATCGAESATAQFETGFAPPNPRDVVLLFRPPAGTPAITSLVLHYGPTPGLGSSVTATCSGGSCSALVSTNQPFLYWRSVYQDAGANEVASSGVLNLAPR